MTTTKAEYKERVRRFVDDVFNEGELNRLDDYLAEGYVEYSSASPVPIEGVEATKEYYGDIRAGFPDLHVTIDDLIAEGNKVVQRSTISGTHDGEFMDIPPTGTEAEIDGIVIYEFEGDEVVRSWSQADIMGLMQQLDVVEPPGE